MINVRGSVTAVTNGRGGISSTTDCDGTNRVSGTSPVTSDKILIIT